MLNSESSAPPLDHGGPPGNYEDSSDTILSLYRQVAIFYFGKHKRLWDLTVKKNMLSNSDIPSLHTEHQRHFNGTEWRKISLFEWHSMTEYGMAATTYVQKVNKKYTFLNTC